MSEDIRIFDTTNVEHERVQHQQLFYFDQGDEFDQRMTIYTGELIIGHGTESHLVEVDFEYPLLARFPPVGAGPRVGIFPINEPLPPGAAGRSQFRSAVADASIAVMWGKDDEAHFGIYNVRAELDRIVLDDPRETPFPHPYMRNCGNFNFSQIRQLCYFCPHVCRPPFPLVSVETDGGERMRFACADIATCSSNKIPYIASKRVRNVRRNYFCRRFEGDREFEVLDC